MDLEPHRAVVAGANAPYSTEVERLVGTSKPGVNFHPLLWAVAVEAL